MVNKYKLIKKLPFEGSPEIGYISEEKMVGSGIHYWNANWFDPANYPEFWELVAEKDWKILDQGYNGLIGKWEIKAVRRECDGEIFSVGDKLDLRAGGIRKITGISLDDTGVSEFSKIEIPWLECGKEYGICLDWAVHYKEPILITEDGVELFEGDNFFCVMGSYNILNGVFVSRYVAKEFKYFSTRKGAEKYIEENEPVYSKKDMLSFGASMSSRLYPYQCEGCLEQWKKFKKGE